MARKRKKKLSTSTKEARRHKKVMARTKAGSGARFKSMVQALKKKGARSPKALAAWIGRKKYGKKGMAKMAAAGRKRRKK